MSNKNRWTLDQILAFGMLIVAIIALFVQIQDLKNKIQPIIEMKPQINNVIQNITKVEKEIANLNEVLDQEDKLKVTEVFTKADLGIRVKKLNSDNTGGGYLIFELKKAPLNSSVSIAGPLGTISPATFKIAWNIVWAHGTNVEDFDYYSITYIPSDHQRILKKIKNANFKYLGNEVINITNMENY